MGFFAWRNMDIILIYDAMGADYDDGVRFQFSDLLCCFAAWRPPLYAAMIQ